MLSLTEPRSPKLDVLRCWFKQKLGNFDILARPHWNPRVFSTKDAPKSTQAEITPPTNFGRALTSPIEIIAFRISLAWAPNKNQHNNRVLLLFQVLFSALFLTWLNWIPTKIVAKKGKQIKKEESWHTQRHTFKDTIPVACSGKDSTVVPAFASPHVRSLIWWLLNHSTKPGDASFMRGCRKKLGLPCQNGSLPGCWSGP